MKPMLPRLIALLLAAPAAVCADLLDFYAHPPTELFPDMQGKVFFNWPNSDSDSYTQTDQLGLRALNEAVAGESGWVTHSGGRFLLGNGRPARFWAVNVNGQSYDGALAQGRFLAKRGVNMVRVHGPKKSLFTGSTLDGVSSAVISQMQANVSAMKQHGIYTFVSNTFFVIEMQVQASYGMPGYTQAWIDANPTKLVPYGLIFLDDTLRAAYKGWLTELMTRPNPNDPQQTPLAADRAVAIVELLNEDNLFFNTFNPDNWPPEMQEIQEQRFFEWVGQKYLDPENPGDTIQAAATRAQQTVWRRVLARDDTDAGRFQLVSAISMSNNTRAVLARNRDQVAYLAEVQEGFFAEMTAHLRSLGYGGTVSASNWKTANDERLLDLELATYAAAGVIDRHNYYSPQYAQKAAIYDISAGDEYLNISALLNPRETPLVTEHVEGHPLTLSEQIWTQYTPVAGEAPLAVAAYMGLSDIDAWVWFALDNRTWNTTSASRPWPVESPSMMGQFPATALMTRRGDLAEAGVVLREGRQWASLTSLDKSLLTTNAGFDYFRDNPALFPVSPVPGTSIVDPALALVGKAILDPSPDADMVLPEAYDFIDTDTGVITSMTGQIVLDSGAGVLTVDTPQTQAANGFLRPAGTIETSDASFTMDNLYGAVITTSLDDQPLRSSTRILIQAFASDQRSGLSTERVPISYRGNTLTGVRILNPGTSSYKVERVNATVRLKGAAARFTRAIALSEYLYFRSQLTPAIDGDDLVVRLPSTSLYTVIELEPAAGADAAIHTRMLPNARIGSAYGGQLRAVGAQGGEWALAPDSPALPAGLTFAPDGTLAGTPAQGGLFVMNFQYTLDGSLLDVQAVRLLVEPVPAAGPWGTPSNLSKLGAVGWLNDLNLPYVWFFSVPCWAYVHPSSTASGIYLYRYTASAPGWIWTSESLGGWYYDYAATAWARF
ncbi:MAG: putative Ig domain-containing protein [Oceanipulchritudo sp.]